MTQTPRPAGITYSNTDIEYGTLPYLGDIHEAKNGGHYVETTPAEAPERGAMIGDTMAGAWTVTGQGKTYTRRVEMVRQDFTGDFPEGEGGQYWQEMELVRSYVKQV